MTTMSKICYTNLYVFCMHAGAGMLTGSETWLDVDEHADEQRAGFSGADMSELSAIGTSTANVGKPT